MNRNLNLILCLAAGLIGGVLSRWVVPAPVLAQAPASALKDIRAQRFTLVTEDGRILGTFGPDQPLNNNAMPVIKLFDPSGREIWSAGGSGFIRKLSER